MPFLRRSWGLRTAYEDPSRFPGALQTHLVEKIALKRANRRCGAGGKGLAALEDAKEFLRSGLLLSATEPKRFELPYLRTRPAPYR